MIKKNYSKLCLAFSFLIASDAYSGGAQLEEVIVTAQKREQNLQDVPMAVTAIGRELIENNEINSIQDLTKVVPSLRFSSDAYINSAVNIRGVGTNVYSVAVEPNVSVMLDGVVLARNSLATFDFADIERIEVLRGPQGTLFGKNASAGLVHVITRDPSPEFEARVRSSFEQPENFPGDFMKLQTSVSGPLSKGLGLRVTAYGKQSNGHLEDIQQNTNEPDSVFFGLRSKLRWDPSEALTLRLNLEHQVKDGHSGLMTYRDGNPSLRERSAPIEFGEHNRLARSHGNNFSDSKTSAASLSVDWDVGSFVLSSVTAFREANNHDNITVYGLDGQRGHLRSNVTEIDIETFTQEFRITSANNERFEYTAGVLWFDNWVKEDYDRDITDLPATLVAGTFVPIAIPAGIGDGLGGADAVNNYDTRDAVVEIQNLGLFAEGTWHLADDWHVTAGARYIDESVAVVLDTSAQLSYTGTGTELQSSSFSSPSVTTSDKTVTGKIALLYDWADDITAYGSISTGYRGATFDLAGEDEQAALDNPVDPEKALAYEFGLKSRLFDNRLELNVAAFLTYFEDFQAQIRDLQTTGSIVAHRLDNAGELETRGVEIEFQARPFEALTVGGAVLFNRAVFNEFVTQCFAGQRADEGGAIDSDGDGNCDAQDVAGGVLANAPKRTVSINARYEHMLIDVDNVLYGQINTRWQDDVQFTNEQQPTTIQEGYGITDLRFGWLGAENAFELAAYVNNVFAQSYVVMMTPLSVANDRRDIVHSLPVGADRIYGVSLAYRW